MNDLKIEIQNFVSIFHGFCIFSFKCNENQSFTYDNLLKYGKKILKEELVEFKAIGKNIDEILAKYEYHLNLLSKYPLSSNSKKLKVIFQNIFKNASNSSDTFPYPYKSNITYYFPVGSHEPLTLSNYVDDPTLNIQDLKSLYQKFVNELNPLRNIQDLKSFNTTFYFLFYKYSIHIPCFIDQLEDVSLFDFIRVITAFYNCNFYEKTSKEKPFLMVKGDITGIQNYIYSDISLDKPGDGAGLTKKLRARSFFISLLTDFIASVLIEQFQLPDANIIYSGGGHFLTILPNTENAQSTLVEIEKKINKMLSEIIKLKLSFICGKTTLCDSFLNNASIAIQNVNINLTQVKQQKFLTYIDEFYEFKLSDEFEKRSENLGKLITQSNFFAKVHLNLNKKSVNEPFNENSFVVYFNEFSVSYHFFSSDTELKDFLEKYEQIIQKVRIYSINKLNFTDAFNNPLRYHFPIEFAYQIIAAYVPKDSNEEIITFEKISELGGILKKDNDSETKENEELSFGRLGVLRLDVDNLGAIFAFGLEENKKTSLMRVATLSRELHQYFSGYSNTLCEKYQIYTVYSGGDDAFFIGSWLNILHFAKEFRDKFFELTCRNPNFTFSAGIFMCDPHHPIGKFAEQAAEMEELSKKFKEGRKNALTVFDHTLSWESYNEMLNFAETLLKYVDEKASNAKDTEKFARSFVHRILRMIKSSLHSKGPQKGEVDITSMFKNSVQLKYLLARRGFDAQKIEETQKEIVQKVVKVIINNFDKKELIKNYIIPMSYVILKTRVIKNN